MTFTKGVFLSTSSYSLPGQGPVMVSLSLFRRCDMNLYVIGRGFSLWAGRYDLSNWYVGDRKE